MKLFNKEMTRREIESYMGRTEQAFGIRLAELADGRERGVRIATVRNGAGLTFTVLLDRGLDIGDAEFAGVPLAFLATGEFSHPAYYDERGLGWLRNWGAGLLTGCGLRNVGGPGEVDGEAFGIHGRLSNLPARGVQVRECWDGDRCTLVLEGDVTEARMFGENLRLTRRYSVPVGGSTVRIEDTVRNAGFKPEPVFLLYHINWGFPMVHETTVLEAVPHTLKPRDAEAAKGTDSWNKMQPPTAGYSEQCFYHDIPAGKDGFARLALRSPLAGLRAEVAYRKAELPNLIQWKMMGQGAYVTGLEPANCWVGGRASELKGTPHCVLAGGESRSFCVELKVEKG